MQIGYKQLLIVITLILLCDDFASICTLNRPMAIVLQALSHVRRTIISASIPLSKLNHNPNINVVSFREPQTPYNPHNRSHTAVK